MMLILKKYILLLNDYTTSNDLKLETINLDKFRKPDTESWRITKDE